MRNLITLISLLMMAGFGFAQPNGGGGTGILTGTVLDKASQKPIEFATISLMRVKDSAVVSGGITDMSGKFNLEGVPFGKYRAKVGFMGYTSAVIEGIGIFPPDNLRKDLGNVQLSEASATLDNVVVTAERAAFQNSIDKKVFNVDKNLSAAGGSAADILRNVPSVNVDMDGNVQLRGSGNVQVLIDGKPSALMGDLASAMKQLPASSIESIELVTNPSAKYDPEGVAGIINIVLKKNKQKGWNASVQLGAGSGNDFSTVNKYNGSVNFNYRTAKYNLFTNYSYRQEERFGYGYFFRDSRYGAGIFTLDQPFSSNNKNYFHQARVGMDVYLTPTTTLGWSIGGGKNDGNKKERVDYFGYDSLEVVRNYYYRQNATPEHNYNYDGGLNFKHNFKQPRQELTASANYSVSRKAEDAVFYEKYVTADYLPLGNVMKEENENETNSFNAVLQADYVQPLWKGKLETGYKGTLRGIDTDLQFFRNDAVDNFRTNRFQYNENIQALYGTFTNSISDKLGYQAGLRLEETFITGKLFTTDKNFKRDYFSLFPSANLTYAIKPQKEELRLSYSRRIRRPSNQEVNPFPDYSDPTVQRYGNPDLRPEFTNSFELGYMKRWEGHSLTSTLYARRTSDQINRFIAVNADNGLTTVSFQNFAYRNNYGLEIIGNNEWAKWWNTTLTLNGFQTEVSTGSLGGGATGSGLGWSGRLLSNMTFKKVWNVQVSGMYNAPFVMAQGKFRGMSSADLGVRYSFLKGQASVGANLSDVFNTGHFFVQTSGVNFAQEVYRKRETRFLMLTLSYRLGNGKADENRKPNRGSREGGEAPDMGGGF